MTSKLMISLDYAAQAERISNLNLRNRIKTIFNFFSRKKSNQAQFEFAQNILI